ncbi:hypothetical protein [Frigoribacterium sp. UYMn621]|jgi:hypothetical protein|uniref:hypothetical protein n=1 Tax=Frigoribacterium sp. UYMn621 TaxID=3156343 RepID=UPI00339160D6
MPTNFKVKALSIAASVALLGGTAFLASGATGAYFSDTHSGNISGTVGNIHVVPFGGGGATGTDLAFSNLLPGVAKTVTLKYKNTGSDNQDVYIVFNNATALSALNDAGTFGEVHLAANGTPIFDSANLNDHLSPLHCLTFDPSGCWPLKSQYLLASNVAPGATGDVSFSYTIAGKYKGQAAAGAAAAPWNSFPVAGQTTTNSADGTSAGLPYEIVATQHGITPGI